MIVNPENYYLNSATSHYKYFTVKIDQSVADPKTSCTYLDDAVGMTPGSADWDKMPIFKDIKPCVFKAGKVVYYLDPNDFNQKADGGGAANLTGDDGDVMIEFPRFGYRITTTDDDQAFVSITDNPNDPDYGYYAFIRESDKSQRYKMYKGAFKAYYDGTSMRSISGVAPEASKTIDAYRQEAQANGEGYDSTTAGSIIALQCLYLIRYCNRDGQAALGQGWVSMTGPANTGGTVSKGMYYGNPAVGSEQMKFAGIEDFWGNIWEWVNGVTTDGDFNIIADYGGDKVVFPTGISTHIDGYTSKIVGNTMIGFHAKEVQASQTTQWCDWSCIYQNCIWVFGGAWSYGVAAGPFLLDLHNAPSATLANVSSRLLYV